MRERVVFIAGPYASGPLTIEENIAVARQAAQEYWARGYTVICPHTNTAHFEKDCSVTWEDYCEGYLELLRRSNIIVLLPNWEGSMGTRREYEEAKRWRLRVEYYKR